MTSYDLSDGDVQRALRIQRAWTKGREEILQVFIDLNREPSDKALEALSSVLSGSHNEVRRVIALQANSQGSTLLSDYLPA
jgi:hypothetical protein